MNRPKWTLGLAALALIAAVAVPQTVFAQDLSSVANRTDDERARDAGSKPGHVYAFWGLEAGMTVVDLIPGGGYNTGMVYAGPPRDALTERLQANPISNVEIFGDPADVPDASADAVVTVRNFHDVVGGGRTEGILANVHRVLKSGGTFGVVDARTNMDGYDDSSHRINQQHVIDLVTAAGFEFVEASEMLANADDDFGTWEGASGRTNTDRMVLKFRKGM